ncbi:MAG: rhomboid family intramembrane serine protease [Anaerolineae bacterium]|nr:rhomboid family intramembrane serine protease [Anaerolineae bacterium]NUQ06170.1 rhomboid family intramembrane serine protease [Anaerolineae bacterium]
MLNTPPPEDRQDRKRHPLERDPQPPPIPPSDEPPQAQRQRLTLHIATVKPYVVYAIIVLNVLIFAVRALSPQIDQQLTQWGANVPLYVLQDGEAYRLLTAMFLHLGVYNSFGGLALAGALHIFLNMYILYGTGVRTEQVFGHARFAVIYLLGGLAGSVLSAVFGAASDDLLTASLGASGAVFAVISARWVYLYKHRLLFGVGGRIEQARLAQFLAINLIFGLFTAIGTSSLGRIDNFAHIGGVLGGALLAWVISPFFVLRSHPDQTGRAVMADDINPLQTHYREVTLFAILLMALLIVVRLLYSP